MFGLSKTETEAFISQVMSLLNAPGAKSTLEQNLKAVLSMLGVSHNMQAVILSKVRHLNASGSEMLADLQHLEAFLANSGMPNFALFDQVWELLKSSNFSTADVLAVVQHVQGLVSDLQGLRARGGCEGFVWFG